MKTETEKKQVNYNISMIRFISMLMIIICHFCQYYGNELMHWFNGGVHIFLVISGFLHGRKTIERPVSFIKRKFKAILIPYYTFLFSAILIYVLFAETNISVKAIIGAIFCADTISGIGHLWFIPYILVCYLITPYLYSFVKEYEKRSCIKFSAVCVILLILLQILADEYDSFFKVEYITSYVFGYMLSVYCSRYGKYVIKWLFGIVASLALLMNAARIYIKYMAEIQLSGISLKLFSFLEPYAHMLLFWAIFMALYFVPYNIPESGLINFSDKYSYDIYIVHQFFILSPFSLMQITPVIPLNWLIVAAATIVSAAALNFTSKKIARHTG